MLLDGVFSDAIGGFPEHLGEVHVDLIAHLDRPGFKHDVQEGLHGVVAADDHLLALLQGGQGLLDGGVRPQGKEHLSDFVVHHRSEPGGGYAATEPRLRFFPRLLEIVVQLCHPPAECPGKTKDSPQVLGQVVRPLPVPGSVLGVHLHRNVNPGKGKLVPDHLAAQGPLVGDPLLEGHAAAHQVVHDGVEIHIKVSKFGAMVEAHGVGPFGIGGRRVDHAPGRWGYVVPEKSPGLAICPRPLVRLVQNHDAPGGQVAQERHFPGHGPAVDLVVGGENSVEPGRQGAAPYGFLDGVKVQLSDDVAANVGDPGPVLVAGKDQGVHFGFDVLHIPVHGRKQAVILRQKDGDQALVLGVAHDGRHHAALAHAGLVTDHEAPGAPLDGVDGQGHTLNLLGPHDLYRSSLVL